LEEELCSGLITNDQDLIARAKELRASLQVTDGREKVWRQGDVLVGEVTEISAKLERRRRIYLVPGAHLIVDVVGREAKVAGAGKVGCVVFGNRFTQKLAGERVGGARGEVNEDLIKRILTDAGQRTASVSQEYSVLRTDTMQSDPEATLWKALQEDCEKNGWRLCGQR
jgi:hypothetical protein